MIQKSSNIVNADRTTVPALDVYAARSDNGGGSWAISKVTDVKSNGNYEQFDNRVVPFGGDYLWITARGEFAFGTWTDWRISLQGSDPREVQEDEDAGTADVKQCHVRRRDRCVERRPVPARRRHRPGHLRRSDAIAMKVH